MPITLGDTSITSSTGKVGIGSGFTPATGLHAQSSTVEADRSLRLAFDATFFSEIRQLGAGGMGFRNNSVDNLMAIDGSGRVTMPFQPAFDVASTVGVGAVAQQTYNTVFVNRGSHFSTSTGRFTAPVTGFYVFTAATIKTDSSNAVSRLFLRKNGAVLHGARHLRLSEGSLYGDGSCSWGVQLTANEFVDVFMNGAIGSHGSFEYTWFTGHLVG